MKYSLMKVCALVLCLSLSALAQNVKKEPVAQPVVVDQTVDLTGVGTVWEAVQPGETPDTAEAPECEGALAGITGTLTGAQAHVFLIGVTAAGFGATTVGTPGTLEDTMLALFDVDGNGVYFDDDSPVPGEGLRSRLPVGHAFGPQKDGCYYLGMSGYARHAASDGGLIWNPTPFDVVRAPDGPGAPGPLTTWAGTHAGGTYTINLTGADCSCAIVK